jgi:hypothetical protein
VHNQCNGVVKCLFSKKKEFSRVYYYRIVAIAQIGKTSAVPKLYEKEEWFMSELNKLKQTERIEEAEKKAIKKEQAQKEQALGNSKDIIQEENK